jgi:hypothetical protein
VLRKVNYEWTLVLASKAVVESISSILESLRNSDLEEAKRKLQALGPEVKNDRDRGSLLAASGIYTSMAKAKEGAVQSWDPERIERAARTITSSQMADDLDIGYAETLMKYARITQGSRQTEA